jgi:hypothetical protein
VVNNKQKKRSENKIRADRAEAETETETETEVETETEIETETEKGMEEGGREERQCASGREGQRKMEGGQEEG